jgi:hypothetical protein
MKPHQIRTCNTIYKNLRAGVVGAKAMESKARQAQHVGEIESAKSREFSTMKLNSAAKESRRRAKYQYELREAIEQALKMYTSICDSENSAK